MTAAAQRLWRAMRSAVRAVTAVTVSGPLERLEVLAAQLLPTTVTPQPGPVARAAACSLASRGQAVREVVLRPRMESLPAGLVGLAGST